MINSLPPTQFEIVADQECKQDSLFDRYQQYCQNLEFKSVACELPDFFEAKQKFSPNLFETTTTTTTTVSGTSIAPTTSTTTLPYHQSF